MTWERSDSTAIHLPMTVNDRRPRQAFPASVRKSLRLFEMCSLDRVRDLARLLR